MKAATAVNGGPDEVREEGRRLPYELQGQLHAKFVECLNQIKAGNFSAQYFGNLLQKTTEGVRFVEEYIIDFDTAPFCPEGWIVVEHKPCGTWKFNPEHVIPHLFPRQEGSGKILGINLRKDLALMPVVNANLLDHFYLKNPELIPKEWEWKEVYFWGTIYEDEFYKLCVRCLTHRDGMWKWGYRHLTSFWGYNAPALVFASFSA